MVSSLLEMSSVVVILLVAWEVHATNYLATTYPNIEACVLTNPCCNVVKDGLVLQTQYWDTYTGLEIYGQLLPSSTWTIHGLWLDNCDGSYDQYCDLTRQYDPDPSPSVLPDGTPVPPYTGPSVKTFSEDFGRWDLLKCNFWINQGAPNEDFWAHEFSKHATCTSTFDVACYEPDYKEHQDVVNSYEAVVKVFQLYPTYNMLAAAGIVPSNGTTYTLAQITNALYSQTGAIPYLGYSGNGVVLDEVWYFHHVLGTVRTPAQVDSVHGLKKTMTGAVRSLQDHQFHHAVKLRSGGIVVL
ncbi:ribonuclease T2 [Pisolithus croceorrhizus]|nr:ribonuclease T2 [Pisolithus croceorrhizus]